MFCMRKKKISEISDLIIKYSDGQVSRPVAEAETIAFFKRRGFFSNPFIHGDEPSGIAKKLAYKCMGRPIV